jgi:hypothetical protein
MRVREIIVLLNSRWLQAPLEQLGQHGDRTGHELRRFQHRAAVDREQAARESDDQ